MKLVKSYFRLIYLVINVFIIILVYSLNMVRLLIFSVREMETVKVNATVTA